MALLPASNRKITGPFTLVFNPSSVGIDVAGTLETEPFDMIDGVHEHDRKVRIDRVSVIVSFDAGHEPRLSFIGSGKQVRKDGTLGRDVRGIALYPDEFQRESGLRLAASLVRRDLDALLGQ